MRRPSPAAGRIIRFSKDDPAPGAKRSIINSPSMASLRLEKKLTSFIRLL